MDHENFDFEEIMKSRRQAVKESLDTISRAQLQALTGELFPSADHPWLEKSSDVVKDPASGRFHHALADDRTHLLYCHDRNIGLWFIPGIGKGPLSPEHLAIMRAIVESNPQRR